MKPSEVRAAAKEQAGAGSQRLMKKSLGGMAKSSAHQVASLPPPALENAFFAAKLQFSVGNLAMFGQNCYGGLFERHGERAS